jgi:fusaric acid resistance family protein
VTARSAVVQSVALALACLASYSLVSHASAYIHPLSYADDQIGGLWAVIATAFVLRTSQAESIIAAKTRVAATALSFALCFAYLLFLPSHAWGMAALIAVGTFVLTSAGQSRDVGVGAITTAAVMVIASLSPHHPWQQPLIGAAGTAIGIAIGLAASWLADDDLVPGLRREPNATEREEFVWAAGAIAPSRLRRSRRRARDGSG